MSEAKAKLPKLTRAGVSKPSDGRPDEHKLLVDMLAGIAEALQETVSAHTEIVIHDLHCPEKSIVKIINGHVSGRKEGQSILSVMSDDKGLWKLVSSEVPSDPYGVTAIKNYQCTTRDGRLLYSSSVIINDLQGAPATAFCVNSDREGLLKTLRDFERTLLPLSKPKEDLHEKQVSGGEDSELTMEELINEIIDTALAEYGSAPERMTKNEKLSAVAKMKSRGLFLIRGSVELVASRLGATRHTIYNYLDEADGDGK